MYSSPLVDEVPVDSVKGIRTEKLIFDQSYYSFLAEKFWRIISSAYRRSYNIPLNLS